MVNNKTTGADNRISKEILSLANNYVAKHEPKLVCDTKEISADFFYYGKGMQHKLINHFLKNFLTYVRSKYGESKKQSIITNDVIVTEMEKPKSYATEVEFIGEA